METNKSLFSRRARHGLRVPFLPRHRILAVQGEIGRRVAAQAVFQGKAVAGHEQEQEQEQEDDERVHGFFAAQGRSLGRAAGLASCASSIWSSSASISASLRGRYSSLAAGFSSMRATTMPAS